MRDTMNIADKLQAAGFDDRQARAIVSAQTEALGDYARQSELEKLVVRVDGMDRWLKFVAVGVAALLIKQFLN